MIIGRNEGQRLRSCLASVADAVRHVIYVDSGSTDGSVDLARGMGAAVVELDMSIAFTAARARNEGFQYLLKLDPGITYVQFVDGDCEVVDGWLRKAEAYLRRHEDAAVACGRRRERFPGRSVYNLLCDMEWDTPVGDTKSCGGDAMFRVDAFRNVLGFRPDLIAGEEPELCVRLRAKGWRIHRLDEEMTLHDAAIVRFSQWWLRTMRSGYAYAQGVHLHGAPPERHCVRESRSIWFWALGIPLGMSVLAPWFGKWTLLLLAAYPLQILRLGLRGDRPGNGNWWRATFLVLGKFPELLGQVKYLTHRHLGGRARLIEYK